MIRNKKAGLKYELLETVECGIVLEGAEVKSIRSGKASLDESYARLQGAEIWLIGCHINPYENADNAHYNPIRPRKLLLKKAEINKIIPKVTIKGHTLVPVNIHFNSRGIAKLSLAIARGKAKQDKRQDLKKQEHHKEMDRAMRKRR
jgi:SsrA-binding protein